ncbi:MarR family winged helix-turn-helix transcriptional regulator [Acinetobacter calcoaceticus]|uniref:MarR family winged helix-turn-helix transcriptional regulator n=1 Tax=Acinetobacter calcoaceticus TaxID=471 RepID=UPI0002D092E4|nr:MarR family transcriptional regulator [Acinetobacter calcoaceticus]ENU08612.1 hypothetical protein F997_02059 [Acinetobacter calcoaceticus NIPH 13]WNY29603.1 MarR family transcriptional regulator [Acinetobacter calcoaceticus]
MKNQNNSLENDEVGKILEQWKRERPDLNASPMGPIGRIKRCSTLIERLLESNFSRFDLNLWEFDMLATLRRSGFPYKLSPTELFSALMITSGTMTHRLKKLEQKNLVERIDNEDDARSMLVQLTSHGLELINDAVEAHIENERLILSVLSSNEIDNLNASLSVLLHSLDTSSNKVK